MTRAEFNKLTEDYERAHADFMAFVDRFSRDGPQMAPPPSREEWDQMVVAHRRLEDLGDRWMTALKDPARFST